MNILVTGGAGYIGSHTVLSLLQAGHQVVVVDNFDNSKPEALRRVAKLAGLPGSGATASKTLIMDWPGKLSVHAADACVESDLKPVFAANRFDAVIHFAGLKAVGESVQLPMKYYEVNLGSTMTLIRVMNAAGCRNLVFSSSATVYGVPETLPLTEDCRLSAESPYGRTKLIIEDMLRDLAVTNNLKAGQPVGAPWRIALLRYFNPVGAHPSGTMGEDPNGIPNNLFPFVTQVAIGRRPELSVYGSDYPTPDGTGVRDYLHVQDLADGHVKAVETILGPKAWTGAEAINLGTGVGYSVLDVIKTFEGASGKKLTYQLVARRPGDVPACYAAPGKAKALLGWEAKHSLKQMCEDSWRWQQQNPQGYPAE